MPRDKNKQIEKALKQALSEAIRARKDPDPNWSPGEQIDTDLPVEATSVAVLAPAAGSSKNESVATDENRLSSDASEKR